MFLNIFLEAEFERSFLDEALDFLMLRLNEIWITGSLVLRREYLGDVYLQRVSVFVSIKEFGHGFALWIGSMICAKGFDFLDMILEYLHAPRVCVLNFQILACLPYNLEWSNPLVRLDVIEFLRENHYLFGWGVGSVGIPGCLLGKSDGDSAFGHMLLHFGTCDGHCLEASCLVQAGIHNAK